MSQAFILNDGCMAHTLIVALRTLNISRAISTTDFTVNGIHFHRESFASHPDHAIVSHIASDAKGQVNFTVRLSRLTAAVTTPLDNNTLVMRGNTTFPAQPVVPARPPITEGPRKGFPGRPAKPAVDPDWSASKLRRAKLRSIHGTKARVRYDKNTMAVELSEGKQISITPTKSGKLILSQPQRTHMAN